MTPSIGLASDWLILSPFGMRQETADYIAVKSPDFPTFYFGNYLIVKHPPHDPDTAIKWFQTAFPDPRIRHVTLQWTGLPISDAARITYANRGFNYSTETVLTTPMPTPQTIPDGITCRPLTSDADWEQAVMLQYETGRNDWPDYLPFARQLIQTHRHRVALGMGHWYGAFDGELLVGDLGLFAQNGLARYQNVETRASHRGRGVASALLSYAARHMAQSHTIDTFVIIAKAQSNAQRLYVKNGFSLVETNHALCRQP